MKSTEPTIVIDKREVLADGTVRFYRVYSDGFGYGGTYHPDDDAVDADRETPCSMEKVSSTAIRRMEDSATTERDRAYLESKWDQSWASE